MFLLCSFFHHQTLDSSVVGTALMYQHQVTFPHQRMKHLKIKMSTEGFQWVLGDAVTLLFLSSWHTVFKLSPSFSPCDLSIWYASLIFASSGRDTVQLCSIAMTFAFTFSDNVSPRYWETRRTNISEWHRSYTRDRNVAFTDSQVLLHTLGEITFTNSFKNLNFATSLWNLLPQFFIHVSRT